ncbi:OsmC family protein [Alsobacter sp. SYSU M60028]|uniref:OsmC family protein n=1 Tax=Alsobacter ponti TaxID=2962936 RepID=A0ABT1LDH3_9HYPH|nr:OsmC family protein [Alsobacter ponti]MCP8939547.1 OsmC family protein [Alsobacter ponti]
MATRHRYSAEIVWTGNRGAGTADYRAYGREHEIRFPGKPAIAGSADPAFRGDRDRVNPEEMLVASLSTCHMLWFLHLASVAGLVVESYEDAPEGVMVEEADGAGQFAEVVLRPRVRLSSGDPARVADVHEEAHRFCFVARSVNFPVRCEARP